MNRFEPSKDLKTYDIRFIQMTENIRPQTILQTESISTKWNSPHLNVVPIHTRVLVLAYHKFQHLFYRPIDIVVSPNHWETCASTHPNTSLLPHIDSCNICTLLTSAILIAFKFNFLLPEARVVVRCTHTQMWYVCSWLEHGSARNVLVFAFCELYGATHQTKLLPTPAAHSVSVPTG